MSAPKSKGFTLIELLIVVALIAILAIAGLIAYRLQVQKGYDAIRKRDLNNIKIAFENYFSDRGCYPPSTILSNCGGNQLAPYLEKIPCDPETGAPYTLTVSPTSGCAQKFFASADLSNDSDPEITCDNNGYYMVASPNVNESELAAACIGDTLCPGGYYGCVQGACVLLSTITKPSCNNMQCTSNCSNLCGDPSWEVWPQPCYP